MKIKGLTEEDCAFVYYVLRDWSQNHENYDEQDVDDVYQTVIKLLEQVDLVDVDNYKQNTIISG